MKFRQSPFMLSSELQYSMLFFVGVILLGTIGYASIEGFAWLDSLYMTIITVSTVGFRELGDLSAVGKVFTIVLIFLSLASYGYLVSNFTQYALNSGFFKNIKKRRLMKEIATLEGHTIVVGYGRNGQQAAIVLSRNQEPVVIIDTEQEALKEISGEHVYTVHGDATQDEILESANIERAKAIIVALPEDAANLFVVLSARQKNKELKIITRASASKSIKKLYIAGADNVIMPDYIGGSHMATLVMSPDLVEFIDFITVNSSRDVSLKELSYTELPNEMKGKTLRDLSLRERCGCTIVGIKMESGEYEVNPDPEIPFTTGSKLFVLGNAKQIASLNTILAS